MKTFEIGQDGVTEGLHVIVQKGQIPFVLAGAQIGVPHFNGWNLEGAAVPLMDGVSLIYQDGEMRLMNATLVQETRTNLPGNTCDNKWALNAYGYFRAPFALAAVESIGTRALIKIGYRSAPFGVDLVLVTGDGRAPKQVVGSVHGEDFIASIENPPPQCKFLLAEVKSGDMIEVYRHTRAEVLGTKRWRWSDLQYVSDIKEERRLVRRITFGELTRGGLAYSLLRGEIYSATFDVRVDIYRKPIIPVPADIDKEPLMDYLRKKVRRRKQLFHIEAVSGFFRV